MDYNEKDVQTSPGEPNQQCPGIRKKHEQVRKLHSDRVSHASGQCKVLIKPEFNSMMPVAITPGTEPNVAMRIEGVELLGTRLL